MDFKKIWHKRKKWIITGIIVLGVIIFVATRNGDDLEKYDFIILQTQDLKQEVSVTGIVQPVDEVNLAFEVSGRIQDVFFDVGEHVSVGDELITLDSQDIEAELAQAQAQVAAARADYVSAQANLASVQAQQEQSVVGTEIEQIRLGELERGARSEELEIAETKVRNAEKALRDAQENAAETKLISQTQLDNATINVSDAQDNVSKAKNKAAVDLNNTLQQAEDVLNDAMVKADGAVNKDVDDIFEADSTNYYAELTFEVTDSVLKNLVLNTRRDAIDAIGVLDDIIDGMETSVSAVKTGLQNSKQYLEVVRLFLNYTDDVIDNAFSLAPETAAAYKTSVNAARVNLNLAINAVNSQQQLIDAQIALNDQTIKASETALVKANNDLEITKVSTTNSNTQAQRLVNDAENLLAITEDEYELVLAGATTEQLSTQEAAVKSAQSQQRSSQALVNQAQALLNVRAASVDQALARVKQLESRMAKTKLVAPIDGVITKQEAIKGELVLPERLMVVIISENAFQIEAQVPEVDIAKIQLETLASVTLDAYGDDELFPSYVSRIDPAEEIIDGVPTYKVVLQFNQDDDRIKSGMTANIEIVTAERDTVLAVPQRAVFTENGERFVRVLNAGNSVSEIMVRTGLRSSDGNVEILEGLQEGDRVIIFFEE